MRIYLSSLIVLLFFQFGMAQENMEMDSIPNDTIYKLVDQMPVFGACTSFSTKAERNKCSRQQLMLYVLRTIEIPKNKPTKNLETGEIVVRFVINKDGKVQNPMIVQGIDRNFDQMFIDIFKKMPVWEVGKKEGKKVNVEMTLPMNIHF